MSSYNFKSTHPKAKKQHKCAACGLSIEKGEIYRYYVGVAESHLYSIKMHRFCDEVYIKMLARLHPGEEPFTVPESLSQWRQDFWEKHDLKGKPMNYISLKKAKRYVQNSLAPLTITKLDNQWWLCIVDGSHGGGTDLSKVHRLDVSVALELYRSNKVEFLHGFECAEAVREWREL